MSAGSLRERVAVALHDHGLCIELSDEEGAHEVGTAPCQRFAKVVLAEVVEWLTEAPTQKVVARAIQEAMPVSTGMAGIARATLAALIDETKEVEA